MNKQQFKEFMADQKEEVERYKWYRGEELGYDPGPSASREWIILYASAFRENWEKTHNL